jgi:hypothetical protein
MVHHVLLIVHVATGTAGLLIGPAALAVRKGARHRRVGLAYQVLVAGMTGSAVGLVVLAPARLWALGLVALATEAAALAGWRERRRHRRGWLPRHIRLMCGSYVSFVTAALVVNWSTPVAWVLPTLVGTPLITLAVRRAVPETAPVLLG